MPLDPQSSVAGDTTASSTDAAPDYTAEVRFGVVMYGGVSLAIYINGVTNEIFEMACATPLDGVAIGKMDEPSALMAGEPEEIDGPVDHRRYELCTRDIYRRLSWLVGDAALREDYARRIRAARAAASDGDPADVWSQVDRSRSTQTRFAVDVVAGTSAGGINGLFLAKAIANGERFDPLKNLWVNEGDIALLLNDEKSIADTVPQLVAQAHPASLLNSDRMYAKLHYALGAMTPMKEVRRRDGSAVDGSPLAEEIDLFITTTDIKGSAVPLRLFDKIVYERRFKQNYHFGYPNGITNGGNDFGTPNRSFLAFAARCTSSFPFAFEPMTLETLTRLKVAAGSEVAGWNAFFPNLPRREVDDGKHVKRAFGDGGYLDNKPFSYVVDALSKRFSSVPLERKLVFVEPSPEHLDPDAEPPEHSPDPLQNSLAALTAIPQYETIREDLQAVLTRNRRIERIERVVRLGELSIDVLDPFAIKLTEKKTVPDWSTLKLSDMVRYYGTAILPYQRLRVYSATDSLADRLGNRAEVDSDADTQYALRALVRVWRERHFHDEGADGRQTINAFLDQYDIGYRIRRLAFLLRRVDMLTRLFHKQAARSTTAAAATTKEAGAPPEFSEEEAQLLATLPAPFKGLPDALPRSAIREGEAVLRLLKRGLLASRNLLLEVNRAIDAPPAPGTIAQLRNELNTVLFRILGHETAGDDTIRTGSADGSVEGRTTVAVNLQAARMASASRTLQESVLFRAKAIFAEADRVPDAPIQRWLLDGIASMSMKGGGKPVAGVDCTLDEAAADAWRLLGSPELTVEPGAEAVDGTVPHDIVVGVGDAAPGRAVSFSADELAMLNGDAGKRLRRFLSAYYLRFDTFDQMSFPLYYDTGTGEPSTVEVVRISPIDATNLIDESTGSRKKLAGTALANFGAFLDRRWRLNDIMWGQLDGAERLIQALLPMTDDDTAVVRHELIERAQRRILAKALVPEGRAKLTSLVVEALDATPGDATSDDALKTLFRRLWTGSPAERASMESVLVSLLTEQKLMEFVRTTREIDPKPDPELTLRSAARAVTITGRVLQVISKQHGAGELPSRWLARLGLTIQGIVAVSLPGTLNQRWWTHGVKLLYAFEIVLVVLSLLFGSADLRTLSITALASTFGVHLLSMIAGDLTRGKNAVLHASMMVVLVVVILLAALGALVVVHQGTEQIACWRYPGGVRSDGVGSWACNGVDWFHAKWRGLWPHGETP